MRTNFHPYWGVGRIVWAIWSGLWVFFWFLTGMLSFWPALFTLMPGAAVLGLLVFVERVPQAELPKSNRPRYVTKSGRVLSDADIQRLADEAEAGYSVPREQ